MVVRRRELRATRLPSFYNKAIGIYYLLGDFARPRRLARGFMDKAKINLNSYEAFRQTMLATPAHPLTGLGG